MEFNWVDKVNGTDTILSEDVNLLAKGILDLDEEKASKDEIPTVPTKTSELINDSSFISDTEYVHTDNNFSNLYKEKIDNDVVNMSQLSFTLERVQNFLIPFTIDGSGVLDAYPQAIYSMSSNTIESVNINLLPYYNQEENEIPTYYFSLDTFEDTNGNIIPSLSFTDVIKWAAPFEMKADTHYEIAIRGNCGVIAEFSEVSE